MKIERQTQMEMAVSDSTLLPLLGGIIVFLVGLIGVMAPSLLGNAFPSWFNILLIVAGPLILAFHSTMTITLDKAQGQMNIVKSRLLGILEESESSYPLSDIDHILLTQGYDASVRGGMVFYTITTVLKNGVGIMLGRSQSNNPGNHFSEPEIADKIAAFLGKPVKAEKAPTPGDVLVAMEKTWEMAIGKPEGKQ